MSKIELTPEQMAQGFTIDENVFGDLCLFDKNNNAWRLEFRSIEQAIEASKTLLSCKFCKDCENCVCCDDCDGCRAKNRF